MFQLCISELNEIIEGDVRLGAMPPLAGVLEPVGRVVVDAQQIESRDVFWSMGCNSEQTVYQVDEAFSRGALGVVLQGTVIEPWAGRFSIKVSDTNAALHRLLRCTRTNNDQWITGLFGDDAATQDALQAIWKNDTCTLQVIVDRLNQPSVTFA